jgi:hypothetical protein
VHKYIYEYIYGFHGLSETLLKFDRSDPIVERELCFDVIERELCFDVVERDKRVPLSVGNKLFSS